MKKLIIAPHVDDEVLGCASMLDEDSIILHCGVEDRSYVSSAERIAEFNKVKDAVKCQSKLLKHKVNHYVCQDLIQEFEDAINEFKPDMILIPHPSYNQDHRTVYEAALTALRQHDVNFFVKKVLVYEQPQDFFWDHNTETGFEPNYFIPLDIDKKIKLYLLLKSQVRSFRSPEHLKAMAVIRGGQINQAYAEGFAILRWVD